MFRSQRFLLLLSLSLTILLSGVVSTTSAQDTFVLNGQLIQGTPDGTPLTGDLTLHLSILNTIGEEIATVNTISTGTDFSFQNVPVYPNHFYVVSTTWAGIEQSNFPVKYEELPDVLEVPLYEATTELENVAANRGNLRIETTEVGVQMLLELEYINLGDWIIWGDSGQYPVTVELPVGAFGIAPEQASGDVQRYVVLDQIGDMPIPGIADSQPIVPNWLNVMRVSWLLPYEDGAVVDLRFPFAVANVGIFVRENNLSIESDLFTLTNQQQTSSGRVYRLYEMTDTVKVGDPFKFTLLGKPVPPPTPASEDNTSTSTAFLAVFGIGALLIFTVLMFWFARARRTEGAST